MMILLTENSDIRPGGHPSLKTVRRARARRRWNFRRYDVGRQRLTRHVVTSFGQLYSVLQVMWLRPYLPIYIWVLDHQIMFVNHHAQEDDDILA